MMKRLIFALLTVLTLSGCGKKQFVVDFSLDGNVDGNYHLYFYASDSKQGFWMETMAPVENGRFVYTAPAVRPTLVYILDGFSRSAKAIFYAERGDMIKITGAGNDPAEWKIEGNKLTEEWTRWRLENLKALRSGNADEINACVQRFVNKNPGNRLSALLLLTSFNRRLNPSLFRSLWNSLKESARNDKVVSLAAPSELASSSPFLLGEENTLSSVSKGILKSFSLHTLVNGLDTVNTSKVPSLLLFWHAQDKTHESTIRQLKDLAEEFPDSATRNIVDISLDADSLTWSGNCVRDSLRHTLRGWLPQGEASQLAMDLGVVATPACVVVRPGGKIEYNGNDLDKGASLFRKLKNRKN